MILAWHSLPLVPFRVPSSEFRVQKCLSVGGAQGVRCQDLLSQGLFLPQSVRDVLTHLRAATAATQEFFSDSHLLLPFAMCWEMISCEHYKRLLLFDIQEVEEHLKRLAVAVVFLAI